MAAVLAVVHMAVFNLVLAVGVAAAGLLGGHFPPSVSHNNRSLATVPQATPNRLITTYPTRVAKATKPASKEQGRLSDCNSVGGFM